MTIFIVDAQQSVAFSSPTFTVGETTPQAVITVCASASRPAR